MRWDTGSGCYGYEDKKEKLLTNLLKDTTENGTQTDSAVLSL